MSDVANWRTDTNAVDYFGQQKKQLAVADRRPVIRKASDLVGPGIGAQAVPVSDLNDVLATFDGYFSANDATLNAPSSDPGDMFVGHVVSDASYGGEQVFTRLNDGAIFRRRFIRAPFSPETINWEASWRLVYEIPPTPDPLEGVWQTPTLGNGWVRYSTSFPDAQYMRKDGICYLRGLIKNGTVGTATPFFTLPEGFRPASTMIHIFPCVVGGIVTGAASAGTAHTHTNTNTGGRVNIGGTTSASDGRVSTESPITSTWLSLTGISFPIEA